MFKIDDKNNIFLTRGDSCSFELSIVDESGNPYDFSNDYVQFTVKGNTLTKSIVLQNTIVIGNVFTINSEDTKNLEYGVYKYDVQIITPTNKVYTVIGPADFNLCDEVNFNVTR